MKNSTSLKEESKQPENIKLIHELLIDHKSVLLMYDIKNKEIILEEYEKFLHKMNKPIEKKMYNVQYYCGYVENLRKGYDPSLGLANTDFNLNEVEMNLHWDGHEFLNKDQMWALYEKNAGSLDDED